MADEKKPLLAHLEELRRRIIFSGLAVILLSALSYAYSEGILRLLARGLKPLVFISPQEAFLTHLKIALFCGIVLSAPVILYNMLRFAWMALKRREKRIFAGYLSAGVLLFASGVLFSYYVALPVAMRFLMGFSSDLVRPFISVSRYVSFSTFLILAFAVAFEMPLFVTLLARVGIVNAELLRRKRKYLIVFLFVTAALLTPPDVITQILLAIPLIALYEISILFAAAAEKKKK